MDFEKKNASEQLHTKECMVTLSWGRIMDHFILLGSICLSSLNIVALKDAEIFHEISLIVFVQYNNYLPIILV